MPGRTLSNDEAKVQPSPHLPRKFSHRRSWSKYVLSLLSRSRDASPDSSLSATQPSTEDQSPPLSQSSTEVRPCTADKTSQVTADHLALAARILTIILRYKLPVRDGNVEKSNAKFLQHIASRISHSEPIRMCLPAFPFKSPNASSKVLGALPDKGEEFALAHLNGLCAAITHIYKPGARLMIISDGLVYNDLLGVADSTVWSYGEALRNLATEKGFKHIEFSRLGDLVEMKHPGEMDKIKYISNATNFRHALLAQHGDPTYDASAKIHSDEDTCLTYRGYIKFLMTDLEDVYPIGMERTKSQYKKGIEYIAQQMLFRGDAFARAVKSTFSDHIRLSIHPSESGNKISISVLPTDTSFTTPWHCCIAFHLDGTTTTGHKSQFAADERYELVSESGRPSFYREKTELLTWALNKGGVTCEPLYPAGLMLRPADGHNALSIEDVDGPKVRALAQRNSPIILRGFAKTRDRDLFVKKSYDLGEPTGWKFGLVLEVKDRGADSRGLNNVLSAEWMPFHFDGLFKTEKKEGTDELVPKPPGFQFFTSVTTSPPDTGYTLFSTSTLVFRHLPRELPLERLRALTWSVSTSSFDASVLRKLPLVVDHPATGVPCLRFHEPWSRSRTTFAATDVEIENASDAGAWDSKGICSVLTDLLHDRRVVYYHSWEKGDLLINDNVLSHHTRSDFTAGCDRELWRINFD